MKTKTLKLILFSITIFLVMACSVFQPAESSNAPSVTSVELSDLDPNSYMKIGLGRIYKVKYSPDGKTLAVATSIGVLLYDTTSYELIRNVPDSFIDNLEWSPDGLQIAYATGSDIKILNLRSGEIVICNEKNRIMFIGDEISWSPDGQLLASSNTTDRDGAIYVWDTTTGKILQKIIHPDKRVSHRYPIGEGIDWSSDGNYLAVAYEFLNIVIPQRNSEVIIWDMTGKKPIVHRRWDVASVHENTVMKGLEWTPNDDYLVLGGDFISIYDAGNGAIISTLDAATANRFALSSDGKIVYLSDKENDVSVTSYSVPKLEKVREYKEGVRSPETIDASPKGDYIVAGNSFVDGFDVWDVQTANLIKTEYLNSHWNKGIVFSPNSEEFAVLAHDDTTYLYNTKDGQLLETIKKGEQNLSIGEKSWAIVGVGGKSFPVSKKSPDNMWLATIEEVQCQGLYCPEDFIFLTVHSTGTKEVLFSYKIDSSSTNLIEWSPDSRWLIATGSPERWGLTIYPIDLTLVPLQIIESTGTIESIAWSPNGKFIGATGYNGVIYLYKADKILNEFFNSNSGITIQ